MKRFLTILLALTMLASVGSVAYAVEGSGEETITDTANNTTVAIGGKYDASEKPKTVYSVNVSWDDLTFQCEILDKRVWNTDTHVYDGQYDLKVTDKAKTVTVLNRSNADVKVKAELKEARTPIQGVQLALTGTADNTEEFTLDDASGTGLNREHNLTVSLSKKSRENPNPEQFKNSQTVTAGTLTITVTAADTWSD